MIRLLSPTASGRRLRLVVAPIGMALVIFATFALSWAFANTTSCTSSASSPTLTGSGFEIDTNANLKVDVTGCIDWLDGGTNSLMASVAAKDDSLSGAGDEAFGQGTSEDSTDPTVVAGSIPPNKSDLKKFGVNTETTPGGKFLQLFWARVQNPSGTTNMDFELNQNYCDPALTTAQKQLVCANNGTARNPVYVTPKRKGGDKLVTYDLSQGGTVPTISIRTWVEAVGKTAAHWSPATVLSGASATALGSVNSSGILSGDAGSVGALDPYTFGEASIAFSGIFGGNTCGSFGSVYLKSRSSDSFSAEIKDFVPPEKVSISNCTTLTTGSAETAVTTGDKIHDTATLAGATSNATGTIEFKLYGPFTATDATADTCTSNPVTTISKSQGDWTYDPQTTNWTVSVDYMATAAGRYRWVAKYTSGDVNNVDAGPTACLDTAEVDTVVQKQPSLSTSATASVTIGSPISDTATLSNATDDATGTITFKLYGPFDATTAASGDSCVDGTSGNLVATLTNPNVSGNGSNYGSGNTTPTAVGRYQWVASYSGDAKNLTASTACKDANEVSVVGKAPATIGTAQSIYPQDSATLSASAGGTPTGNVTFTLFGPNNSTCDPNGAAAKYTQTVALTNGSAVTSNGTVHVDAATADTYRWLVVYGGDANHDGVTSTCGTEHFDLTIVNS
jgi:hypothetical protein